MTPFVFPLDYSRIRLVHSFEELVGTPFGGGVNAICWQRELPGDFGEVLAHLVAAGGVGPVDESGLEALPVSAAGREAIGVLLEDQRLLREQGLQPILDCLDSYPREEEPGAVRTDVYSFHVDCAPVEAETWLCTYCGPSSDGLRNDEALRRVDIPATRAELLAEYGGVEEAGFLEFLRDHCYDLHYAPVPGAVPFSFGRGNLWRIAVEYPGSPVPPCIHRAPETRPGDPPRLLLIS